MPLNRIICLILVLAAQFTFQRTTLAAQAPSLPLVLDVELQPLGAQVHRVIETLNAVGSPLPGKDVTEIENAIKSSNGQAAVAEIQGVLDKHCLVSVNINAESRVKVARGPVKAQLTEQGWRTFLVKVHNEAGVTAELDAVSPNARASSDSPWFSSESDRLLKKQGVPAPTMRLQSELWLDMQSYTKQPLAKELSGLKLEYRLIQLYSRDAGKREAKISFNVGQGTQDIGYRNDVDILFTCESTKDVTLRVRDENGKPTTAAFLIRDAQGQVYPSQAKRVAPDFPFHPQVYRADGETVKLPDGSYTVEFSRGPESLLQKSTITVGARARKFEFKAERWIDPSKFGWWSGDHHIHAAGCAHYTKPTEGVHAPDMMRHCIGEDLKVGCNLTWGPCFDYQKQFFTGKDDKVSQHPYLLHYDVEVSGFGSHNSGHLCLLRLTEQMYPGGDSYKHWPTLCLNTLRWAKKQGAVVGPAHSGWGLEVDTSDLPNYIVPPMNGIGAMEYIVDVTHEVPGPSRKLERAVDFISTVDTPSVWELNIWYHTLNAGYRTRISGETDFPCIYGERVGLGRSYVKLDGKLDYAEWCEGIRQGRNYVGDGRSHLMGFKVNNVALGERGSELRLAQSGRVRASAQVAARLDEKPNDEIRKRSYKQQPYWHIERSRIDDTREVPVELLVNGKPVAKKNIVADGKLQEISFDTTIEQSSWVAMRILPSSHTNPIWVMVGDKPVRPSRRSVEWCLKSVDQLWSQKQRHIKADEMEQAKLDYEHARQAYRKIISECEIE